MTDESQLRDLLARVVPDAPNTVSDARPIAVAGRRRRTRRLAITGVAAALVIGSAVGVVAIRGDDDPSPRIAEDTSSSSAPYDGPVCPAEAPPTDDAVPVLAEVSEVRLCAWRFQAEGDRGGDYTDQQIRDSTPADALVGDHVAVFAAAVEALPAADPGRCASLSILSLSVSTVQLELPGGTVQVSGDECTDVLVGSRPVDAAAVVQTFLDALDGQRDEMDYTRTVDDPLTCGGLASLAPARPRRETLVAATVCPVGSSAPVTAGEPLSAAGLATLEAAWDAAQPVSESHAPRPCAAKAPTGPEGSVVALTDRGDRVLLGVSSCDYLEDLQTWLPDQTFRIPVTVDDLRTG